MKDIVEVLREFGEVEEWTRRPARMEHGGDPRFAPIITWKYHRPSEELREFFRKAVSSFLGTMAWVFSVSGNTWCIMPAYLPEYSISHNNLGEIAAAHELIASSPSFGVRANAELELLALHIQTLGLRPKAEKG